ncbi:MAG: S41 family peptidase [Duncaniella sp.]|nr:S41 family peptidase [Duncaniella sp.]MDE5752125.1 S41 family peptidase [Duncaniella sp.]MDE5919978.1 S41 family peptidase [Duncaniella sp.]MDE6170325.1 S41 family peptidase [Duncaniella sp.]MDE6327016.1 S41 family peptidase [Duncaniella sp.]
MNKRLKSPAVWMPLVIAVALVGGMWIGKTFFNSSGSWNSRTKLDAIMRLIERNYVDDIDTDSLLEQSFADIMSGLDPHSVYIPASDLRSVNEELEGSFSGIGITFNMIGDTINVLEVISGGPSDKVGLMPGDRIVTINDTVASGRKWSNSKVMNSLRGPKNSVVRLGIKRATASNLLPYEVTRGDIPVASVDAAYMIDDKTGYLKINKFGAQTYSEFLNSMVELSADGASRFIIDLRGNGGGFMEPAVLMANEFLSTDLPIVSMKGEHYPEKAPLGSDGSGAFKESEVVVLLDEVSASASEIFAGAIQDNDRGLIVGRRSFGKGLVQNQLQLPDSSAVRLTVARYYTPSGRCIQKTYAPGTDYERDLLTRYEHGEYYNADSIKFDKNLKFNTLHGRTVYGGGGIMPDIFVPNDTIGLTTYYLNVVNGGLIQKYTFDYTDRNRQRLAKSKTTPELMELLPDDDSLLQDFVSYAARSGVAPRWYYINLSRGLLVSSIKAMIARNILGSRSYYEVLNETDQTVMSALNALNDGKAAFPLTQ